MSKKQTDFFGILVFVSIFVITFSTVSYSDEEERFTGNVLGWSGPIAGKTTRITMVIEHWATPEERKELLDALQNEGSDGLLKAMRKNAAGYVWFTGSLRWQLNFASTFQTEKGRVVRLVTERPILFAEVVRGTPRSMGYEFGIVEFILDEAGNGKGTIIPTAKISINKDGKIEIETLGTGPQKLQNVKKTK
jgi:hypothetical protein